MVLAKLMNTSKAHSTLDIGTQLTAPNSSFEHKLKNLAKLISNIRDSFQEPTCPNKTEAPIHVTLMRRNEREIPELNVGTPEQTAGGNSLSSLIV